MWHHIYDKEQQEFHVSRESFIPIKLFYVVSKTYLYCKLRYKTFMKTDLT